MSMNSQDILDAVIDQIPKTPEAAEAAMSGKFSGFAIGNIWDRIYGFNGTVDKMAPLIDAKGGNPNVSEKSYLGAIVRVLTAIFTYGDTTKKDEDPIYNGDLAQDDIETGGDETFKFDNMDGSKMFVRVENIFKYFSTKTKYLFKMLTDLVKDFKTFKEQTAAATESLTKNVDDANKNNESTNTDVLDIKNLLVIIQDDISHLKEGMVAEGKRIAELEKTVDKIVKKYPI